LVAWSALEIAMKTTTLLGVATAAYLVTTPHASAARYALHVALGAAGVALVVVNRALATSLAGIGVDVAYLALCLALLARSLHRPLARSAGA
jgi:hypothetical protein